MIVELVSKMAAVKQIRYNHRNPHEHSMEDSTTKLNLKFEMTDAVNGRKQHDIIFKFEQSG